jgi:hypothetical protein
MVSLLIGDKLASLHFKKNTTVVYLHTEHKGSQQCKPGNQEFLPEREKDIYKYLI